jgi:hypothetical protein
MSLEAGRSHNTLREGARLGFIFATITWLWVALVDAAGGHAFHTFNALGGVVAFTLVHYLLNIVYGYVLVSTIHAAARAPSVIIGLVFGGLILQGGFAMVTTLLASAALGPSAWFAIFGGNLIATVVAAVLMLKTHPVIQYLHQAEAER